MLPRHSMSTRPMMTELRRAPKMKRKKRKKNVRVWRWKGREGDEDVWSVKGRR